jgi:hypothetical protein
MALRSFGTLWLEQPAATRSLTVFRLDCGWNYKVCAGMWMNCWLCVYCGASERAILAIYHDSCVDDDKKEIKIDEYDDDCY